MTIGRFEAEDRHLRTLFGVGAVGDLSDGQLLERFATLGGDPAELAFAALVERHGAMVLRVARSVHRDEHGAHDAFQATFLLLARKARSLWVRDSLGPWLHAVACRVAAHQRSSEIRRRRHERGSAAPEGYRPRDPEADDLGRAIHEEIDRLPERYRSAVVLCHLENLTQNEAARRLGWPVGTLQSRLARGRAKLRERLGRRGLAPTLRGFLPMPAPAALVASTARAAASLQLGGPVAGVIAPAVLAMINATSKGMLMTKLKLGSTILLILGGLLATAMTHGTGRFAVVSGQEAPAPAKSARPPAEPAPTPATLEPVPPGLAGPLSRPGSPRPAGGQPPPIEETSAVEEPRVDPIPPRKPEPESTIPAPDTPQMPELLVFHARWSGPCRELLSELDQLTRKGYPVGRIDIDTQPETTEQFAVKMVPTLIVRQGGRELDRTSGTMPAAKIAEFYNRAVLGVPDPSKARPDTSSATGPRILRAWEPAVRVKLSATNREAVYSSVSVSGAIVKSSPDESIIMTVAHTLTGEFVNGVYQGKILVDLFDGASPPQARPTTSDLPAEIVDINPRLDIALIKIRPGRTLPASPVVPTSWNAKRGMKMYDACCSGDDGLTVRPLKLLEPAHPVDKDKLERATFDKPGQARPTPDELALIKCDMMPKSGRTGGGLFTSDGYLAGISLYSLAEEKAGLYAPPDSIRLMLDRNGLSEVHGGPSPTEPSPRRWPRSSPEPATAAPVSDQERRLADVERKLEQILKALKIDTPNDRKLDLGPNLRTR